MHPRGCSALDQEPKTVPNPGLGTGQDGLTTCTFGQHVGAELELGFGPGFDAVDASRDETRRDASRRN